MTTILNIVIIVAIVLFLVILLVILLRRRRRKNDARPEVIMGGLPGTRPGPPPGYPLLSMQRDPQWVPIGVVRRPA